MRFLPNPIRSFLRFGYEVSFEALDKGAIEILGPFGISYTFRRLAERISQLQSGSVVAGISRPYYHYAFAMLLGSTPFVTFSRMWDSLSSWVDNRSSFIFIVSSFYNNKSSQE
ncbi:NADH:ubiquinone reductase (H(+)-translocating) [Ranunculus cassubicifolius]